MIPSSILKIFQRKSRVKFSKNFADFCNQYFITHLLNKLLLPIKQVQDESSVRITPISKLFVTKYLAPALPWHDTTFKSQIFIIYYSSPESRPYGALSCKNKFYSISWFCKKTTKSSFLNISLLCIPLKTCSYSSSIVPRFLTHKNSDRAMSKITFN